MSSNMFKIALKLAFLAALLSSVCHACGCLLKVLDLLNSAEGSLGKHAKGLGFSVIMRVCQLGLCGDGLDEGPIKAGFFCSQNRALQK